MTSPFSEVFHAAVCVSISIQLIYSNVFIMTDVINLYVSGFKGKTFPILISKVNYKLYVLSYGHERC